MKVKVLLWSIFVTLLLLGSCDLENENHFSITTSEIVLKYRGYTAVHLVWDKSITSDNSPVVYDIYLNNVLIKSDLSDSSFTLNNLTMGEFYNVLVKSKAQNRQYREESLSFSTLKILQLPEDKLSLFVYNISNTSLKPHARANTDLSYEPPYYYKIYLDDVLQYKTRCIYFGGYEGFEPLQNLTPGKSYKVKVTFTYIPYMTPNPAYESDLSFSTSIEQNITTFETPISADFSDLSFSEITGTSARFSWRVKIDGPSCSPGQPISETVKIYLNGVLWYTLPATTSSYTLSGLTSNTNYTAKITYQGYYANGYIIPQKEKEVSFNTGN